eukprot:CAMPEP_0205801878 /NCGR_PEP_ID=MMETSP0205-20121125/4010_1 /ASSEMBLY_ACC=CAM_ASM_000278 /TAXON_ID=36767 /ORGANISM="Euplotes focardii, Strain TN1" /LENGTH=109 /DNA_ID=CAMNT_0053067353 /DNA_START=61 /DNA_END=387 /DNA_ORIENTATION=-
MKIGQIIIKPNGDVELEFSEDHVNAAKGGEITEDVNKDFKIRPVADPGKKAVFFMNKDLGKAKVETKVNYCSNLVPQGLYKSGKKAEEFIRPKTIKDIVSTDRESDRIV